MTFSLLIDGIDKAIYFMQNRIMMSFWRLAKVFSLFLSSGIFSIFIAAASAQTTISYGGTKRSAGPYDRARTAKC